MGREKRSKQLGNKEKLNVQKSNDSFDCRLLQWPFELRFIATFGFSKSHSTPQTLTLLLDENPATAGIKE